MATDYLMFKEQLVDDAGHETGSVIYGFCLDGRFDVAMNRRGRPPYGPSGSDVRELASEVCGRFKGIQRENIFTVGEEETVTNPVGQKTKVMPVSDEEVNIFWEFYSKSAGC